MARTTATNFSGGLQFPYATAATDIFKKEDVQTLAQAVDQHDHTTGKGKSVAPPSTNLLTNGSFEIWQRGGGPFAANSTFAADRWALTIVGTDTLSVSRNTSSADAGSAACAACTFTLGTGAGQSQLIHTLSPNDFTQLGGRRVSLSVRVRCSGANAARVGIYDGSAWNYGAYHTGSGAYETLTASNVLLNTGAAIYVSVFFSASCTAYIDNAMLVVGSQAADYVPLHPSDDLARCLRYYEVIGDSPFTLYIAGNTLGTNPVYQTVYYKARKAVAPTLTKVGTWAVGNCGQPTIDAPGQGECRAWITVTASGYGNAFNDASGKNLVVESNP